MTRREEVDLFASKFAVHLRPVPLLESYADSVWGEVAIDLQRLEAGDSRAYWIALHEFGHIAHGHTGPYMTARNGGSAAVTHIEAEAWLWALEHASAPLNEAGRAILAYGMAGYVRRWGTPDSPEFRRVWSHTAGADLRLLQDVLDPAYLATAEKVLRREPYAEALAA